MGNKWLTDLMMLISVIYINWLNNTDVPLQIYLISVMSQTYYIIIDRGISAPEHGKEVVDELNAVDKRYIYQLMFKVQLPGSVIFDSQIKMHTGTENKDVSLAQEFKNHM